MQLFYRLLFAAFFIFLSPLAWCNENYQAKSCNINPTISTQSLTRMPEQMKLQILQVGEPVLRMAAKELSKEEINSAEIRQLIDLMKNTMNNAGVGLAAPQIGIPLQLIIIEDKKEYWQGISAEDLKRRERKEIPFHVLINPKITEASKEQVEFYEGCLSVDGFVAKIPRSRSVTVECVNEKGEPVTIKAKGWYARILQHEIDHLKGIINVDRMAEKTLTSIENYKKYIAK